MTDTRHAVFRLALRRRLRWGLLPMLVLTVALPTSAQPEAKPADEDTFDHWAPLRPLVGTWSGAIDGKLGTGRGFRAYSWLGKETFLVSRHQSVRLPQELSPSGDQHEELGVFSFDTERQKIVYREFMGEGVVTRSVCEVDGSTLVCSTESVESGPGIRARLTLEIVDRYRFVERYELAWPGRDLELYFDNEWTRVPTLDR